MCSIPAAFDSLRCAYRGATDSINDIDVDLYGGCAYAACCSGDVLVWDVATQQLKAQLRHPHWVNAVRCFPLANSAASFSPTSAGTSVGPIGSSLGLNSASSPTGPFNPSTDALYADVRYKSEIRWVLTGGEDGVVVVWSPMTYRTQNTCRLSTSAITTLQLLPLTREHAKSSGSNGTVNPATANAGSGASVSRELDSFWADDTAFLCAASLLHIHIIQVTSASAELVLLRSLQHTVLITAVTSVCTTVTLPMPLLAVGQEDGTLCLWNCLDWLYHDTLPYPAGETDVDDDARRSPSTIHEPQFEHGVVLSTFAYNRRRCTHFGQAGTDAAASENSTAPRVNLQDFQRHMPGAVSADAAALAEPRCGPLPAALQHVLQLAGRQGNIDQCDPVPLATELRYDSRRITCLASSTGGSSGAHTHLFSGHATGDVLLWGCLRKGVPFLLLKKIVLFKPGAWVWRMCAVKPLMTSIHAKDGAMEGGEKGSNGNPKVLRGKASSSAKVNAAAAPCNTGLNTYYSPLKLLVWSDGGTVEYVSTHINQIMHKEGPGFMASAATCWIGGDMTKNTGKTQAVKANVAAASPSSSPPTNTAGAAALSALVAHQYVLMGNFEGRVERYDISKVMGLVKSFGKAR